MNYIVIKLRNKKGEKRMVERGREKMRERKKRKKKNPSSFVERPALLVWPGLSQFYH